MTRISYDVSNPQVGEIPIRRKKDTSFVGLVCSMLIFLAICILLILLASRWCRFGQDKEFENSIAGSEQLQNKNMTTASTTKATTIQTATTSVDLKNVTESQQRTKFLEGTTITAEETKNGKQDDFMEPIVTTTENNEIQFETTPLDKTTQGDNVDDFNISLNQNATTTDATTTEGITTEITTTEDITTKKRFDETSLLFPSETDVDSHTSHEIIENSTQQIDVRFQQLTGPSVCNDRSCDSAAAKIVTLMDPEKSPCENFYDFACGGNLLYEKEDFNIFDRNLFSNSEIPEFVEKFHLFYSSCVEHEDRFNFRKRKENAKRVLDSIGSFQFDLKTNVTYSITEVLSELILFDVIPFLNVDLDIDPSNSNFILKLLLSDQPISRFEHWSSLYESRNKCLREIEENAIGSQLNLTLVYNFFTLCQQNYSYYLDSIEISMEELDYFANFSQDEISKHVWETRVFIEMELLRLFDSIEPPLNPQENINRNVYESLTLGQLAKEYPKIMWTDLFSKLTNNTVSKETMIQIYNRKCFDDLLGKLMKLDEGRLNNAFLALLGNSLFENTVLPSHRHSRIEYCQKYSRTLMPDIVNYLYKKSIQPYRLRESNEYIKSLYEILKSKFNDSLEKVTWLDDETRKSIRKKLEKIQVVTFRTDDIQTEEKFLNSGYEKLELIENDFQHNLLEIIKFEKKKLFSLQGQKVTNENIFRYFVDAAGKKPIYFYGNNSAYIPYGFTRKIQEDLPAYVKMSQVGFSMAKIFGQAFDSIGIRYGVVLSETANVSYSNFADQTRDMLFLSNPIDFEKREFSFNVHNGLSQSERMAENTGLRILTDLFESFKNESLLPWIRDKYSKEQVFFLTLAQELCRKMSFEEFLVETYERAVLPPQFRIQNILGNSKEFLEVFKCHPGSGMTRFENREQFPYLTDVSKEESEYNL